MNISIRTYDNAEKVGWAGWVESGDQLVFIGLDNKLSEVFTKPNK